MHTYLHMYVLLICGGREDVMEQDDTICLNSTMMGCVRVCVCNMCPIKNWCIYKAVVSTYGMLSYYTYIYDVVSPYWSFESLKAGREALKVETIGSIAKKPT